MNMKQLLHHPPVHPMGLQHIPVPAAATALLPIQFRLPVTTGMRRNMNGRMIMQQLRRLGSAKTMQALGGVMTREYLDSEEAHCLVQDYIFDVDKCISDNCEIYNQYISTPKIR